MKSQLLLIGSGPMAKEYAKVLQAQHAVFLVIGRGSESAEAFRAETGCDVVEGGVEQYLTENNRIPETAIVSVGVGDLAEVTMRLIKKGVRRVLLEKPGALNFSQLKKLADVARSHDASVVIAYNRRFFSSVQKAVEIIEDDGGVTSFNFEFTEWSHVIEKLTTPAEVKERWFLANSSHVVDLAFYLGGLPVELSATRRGELSWHPSGAVFSGNGLSCKGALFSYQANWEAPGRWGVEALTQNHRLYLRPMEELSIQKKGSIQVEKVIIEDSLDKQFKPGLYRQVECFINNDLGGFCSIEDQVKSFQVYEKMAGY